MAGLFMQKLRKRTWMGRLAAAVMAAAVLVLAGAFVSLADESGDTTVLYPVQKSTAWEWAD